MILTCPACATQYTVKDGAIPPGGRQVRCASCKHSWHQDAAETDHPVEAGLGEDAPDAVGGPPVADTAHEVEPIADVPEHEAAEGMIADYEEPSIDGEQAATEEEWPAPGAEAEQSDAYPTGNEEDFDAIPAMRDDDEPGGRMLGWLAGLVLLVIVAAAAFYYFGPADLKARIGIAEAGATPLELMLTTSDRQKLASGNELLAISGRIINPTDREQAVPPIEAELRNKVTKQLVYRWTIAPPARSLPPRGSANFNSAEVDIPEGGDELTVTLGGKAS